MLTFHNVDEAQAAWGAQKPLWEEHGVVIPGAESFLTEGMKHNYMLAMDAQPTLSTAANTGIPAFLTTFVDPSVYEILFAPTRGAEILGERRTGTWVDQTAMFPQVEQVGEVTAYGDFNESGKANANMNFPQRQSWLFQSISEYGELQVERAGLARINWVSEVDKAGLNALNRFLNSSYFLGVYGLQNYGLLNDPNLSAAITPATKAYGGVKWVNNGQIVATANEIFADIQSLWIQLVAQTDGITQDPGQIDADAKMTLALSPQSLVAMTATNSFGVNVKALLKENFPNLRVVSAVQYATNGGNLVQLILDELMGQDTGYCAFNDKARTFPIVRELSAWKKKTVSGTFGAVIRMPLSISQMLGV
jgi:hypothetical protein